MLSLNTSTWRKCLIVSLSGFLAALFSIPGCFSQTNVHRPHNLPGYKIEQWTKVLGKQTVSVCPLGIKVDNIENHMVMLCVEPYKEIVSYSDRTGKINCQPYEKFDNHFARSAALLTGVTLARMSLTKGVESTSGGEKFVTYTEPEGYAKRILAQKRKGQYRYSEPKSVIITGMRLPWQIDRKALDWFSRTIAVPSMPALGSMVTFKTVTNANVIYLKSFKTQRYNFVHDDFKVPKGYKTVADLRALIQDESADDAIRMMIRD